MLLPASAFAQDAIAVALGAAFMPVEVTTTSNWTAADVDVYIPAVGTTGTGSVSIPFVGTIPITNVTGTTTGQTVTISGATGSSTTTTQNIELVSISVAAAAGQHAAASATANAKGATGANSGASMRDIAVLRAETNPVGGGQSFTSQVLVNY